MHSEDTIMDVDVKEEPGTSLSRLCGQQSNVRVCGVSNCCNSNLNTPGLRFFMLPKEKERRNKWLKSMGREDIKAKDNIEKNIRCNVCEVHFNESDFEKVVKRLKVDACPRQGPPLHQEPALFPVKTELTVLTTRGTQTGVAASFGPDLLAAANQERLRLARRVQNLERELDERNAPLTFDPDDDIARRFHKLLEWRDRIKSGSGFDRDLDAFALNLHYLSPRAYSVLRAPLGLPACSDLSRLRLHLPPRLDERALDVLACRLRLLPAADRVHARHCALSVYEMPVGRDLHYDAVLDEVVGLHAVDGFVTDELADCAVAVLVHGLHKEWKQPLAYSLVSSERRAAPALLTWLRHLVAQLVASGLAVRALLLDHTSQLYKHLVAVEGVTVANPRILVDGHEVYCVPDAPRALVDLHRSLQLRNFWRAGKLVASWDHIAALHDAQKKRVLSLTPKITDTHMKKCNNRSRVERSLQVFSRAVSAALETLAAFGALPKEARATAAFFAAVDRMLDVLNSSKVTTTTKIKSAYRRTEEQRRVLEEGRDLFVGLKCGRGGAALALTAAAVLRLGDHLMDEGLEYLLTRRLSLDEVRAFEADMRRGSSEGKGGGRGGLSAPQFADAFSDLYVANMMKRDGDGGDDAYEVLLQADKLVAGVQPPKPTLLSLPDHVEFQLELPASHTLTYVASYLQHAAPAAAGHECGELREAMRALPALPLSRFPAPPVKHEPFRAVLRVPPEDLYQYVVRLEAVFVDVFPRVARGGPVLEALSAVRSPPLPCACYPLDHLLKVFVRLRVHAALQHSRGRASPRLLAGLAPTTPLVI